MSSEPDNLEPAAESQVAASQKDETNHWHWLVVGVTERDKVRALLRFLSQADEIVTIGISDWKRAAVLASLLGSLGLRARLTGNGLLVSLARLGSEADAVLIAFEDWPNEPDWVHCVSFHLPFWNGELLPPPPGSAVALVTLAEMSFIKQHFPEEGELERGELEGGEPLEMDDITAEELVLAMARLAGDLEPGRLAEPEAPDDGSTEASDE